MSQLSKDQIEAVAEWMKETVSTRILIESDIIERFKAAFTSKLSPPNKWYIEGLEANCVPEFTAWRKKINKENSSISFPKNGARVFYYQDGRIYSHDLGFILNKGFVKITIEQWREWYGSENGQFYLNKLR